MDIEIHAHENGLILDNYFLILEIDIKDIETQEYA